MIPAKTSNWIRQFIIFGIIGVLNTLVDIGIFSLLVWLQVQENIAKTLSYTAGLVNSYFLNSLFTFSNKKLKNWKIIIKFIIVNIASLLVSQLVLTYCTQKLHISPFIANLITMLPALVVNFIGNRFWTFREKI